MAPPLPAPPSVGALGRAPQPFPGGGPGNAPAPAPTGVRRVQECNQPDSPAPPSYLRPPHKAVPSPPLPWRPPPLQPALRTVGLAALLQPSGGTESSAGRARVRTEVGATSDPAGSGDTGAEWEGSSRSSGRTMLAPAGPRAARGRCPFWDLGERRSECPPQPGPLCRGAGWEGRLAFVSLLIAFPKAGRL